ncbi:DUF5777 family beta-barrel protein [Bacteroidota bacterium]
MKRYIILLGVFGLLFSSSIQAQDDAVYPPFETITLIDNHTTLNPYKGSITIDIQHRFSPIASVKDLFGIYGSANTRISAGYGVTDKIMVGFGTTRDKKLQDLEWKVSLLSQTESGKIPVSVSYVGNTVLNASDATKFGPSNEFKFAHRMSYMNQIVVSRKFGEKIGLLVAPTFIWLNAVEEGYHNANFSIYGGLRAQVLGFHSIILEYDQPITKADHVDIYPNLSLGAEIGTSTHSFRVFVANYNAIVKNYNVVYNTNNPFSLDYQFGFNISIRF